MRCDLDKMGYKWLANCQVKSGPEGNTLVTLPKPELLFTPPRDQTEEEIETPSAADNQILESDDETELLH